MASGYMKPKNTTCSICGKGVPGSKMVEHKEENHPNARKNSIGKFANQDKGASESFDKTNVRKLSAD